MVSIVVGLLLNWLYAFIIIGIASVCLFIHYESQRRKEILSLAMYIKRLNHLDYTYELQDFNEGDLSLLKSEIHKTMYLLKNYNEELTDQKKFIYTSLSDISHQLRTPIAGIQLMMDLSSEDGLGEEQIEHMQIQIERLQSLVERLLIHIQLEAKSISMNPELISSNELVDDLCKLVSTDKNISLDIETFNFYVDRKWVLEALFNVFHNKIKYADSEIKIKVYQNKLYHFIEITDNGPAIEIGEREKIFDRFYKGASSDSNSIGI